MLQETNGAIVEYGLTAHTGGYVPLTPTFDGCNDYYIQSWPYHTTWYGYPVYVCTDKTKKAIEILKALQAEKQIECKSVPKFIELVEKIAGLL